LQPSAGYLLWRVADTTPDTARVTCDKCRSRLLVTYTASGGQTISVLTLGSAVERDAKALEIFLPPPAAQIQCPACSKNVDTISSRWQ